MICSSSDFKSESGVNNIDTLSRLKVGSTILSQNIHKQNLMLISMTGFGRGEATSETDRGGLTVTAEVRSVNSRFLETSVRLPRTMSDREFEVRELVRKSLESGKLNINETVTRGAEPASVPREVK
mgnify:CR=1 FL=1